MEEQDEVVVRGPSTRAVRVHGRDHLVGFTREALASVVEQIQSGYVTMNIEHLSYLPPVGRWHRAEVEDDADGHSELVIYGHQLHMLRTQDKVLPEAPRNGASAPDSIANAKIVLEPRNFEPDVWRGLKENPPLPVHERFAWSSLPPLIWLILIPVTWAATQFSGGFMKRLGEVTADDFVGWIHAQARRARDSSRDNLVEVRFKITDNLSVSGFISFDVNTKAAIDELREGLDGLGPLASFAGWMNGNDHPVDINLVAFFYHDGVWNLGWWASADSAYLTKWFEKNYPDPKRFLGQPIIGVSEEQAASSQELTLPPEDKEGMREDPELLD